MTGHAALALGIGSTAIFIVSAIVAFVASYDQWVSRDKLTLMLTGLLLPLALAVVVRRRVETTVGILGSVLMVIVPLLGIACLLLPGLDRGVVAGNLAVLIPLAGCAMVLTMARHNSPLLAVQAVLLLVAAGTVLASGETSAVLGLICGITFGVATLWRWRLASPSPRLRVFDVSVVAVLAIACTLYLVLIFAPEWMARLSLSLPDYYRDRFAIWRQTPAIISDYLYTGSGLGASAMVLSSYLFIVHVPYLYHVHNLFLQVGIEQGMMGMIAFGGMSVAGLWSMQVVIRKGSSFVAVCAACVFASIVALLVSGMFESDIFTRTGVMTMFLPFGFAWIIGQYDATARAKQRGEGKHLRVTDLVAAAIPLCLVLIVLAGPALRGQWQANMGALAQTRAELAEFRYPFVSIQDELRRNGSVDLGPAVDYYRSALLQNPANVTALRRLGQVELSQGDLASAQRNLEAALHLAPEQHAIRQLLGEIYATQGRIADAAALWQTVNKGPDQLPGRVWWYEHLGDQQAADNIRTVLAHLRVSAAQ